MNDLSGKKSRESQSDESLNENEETSPKKKAKAIDYSSSSSESDIENYLQKPKDLKLNSSFFQVSPPVKEKVFVEEKKGRLSDTDSDEPLNIYVENRNRSQDESVASSSKASFPAIAVLDIQTSQIDPFKELNKQAVELEEARKQVEAYLAKRKAEKANNEDEVDDLLAIGEKPFDLAKDLAEVGFHASDFESDNESEKEDWEEVQESQETNIIPQEGVQVTVEMPNMIKKKKRIDLMAALKRRMNRIKKENQVLIHKVHLLCWIAHGNYVNDIINQENIMALALSLLPSQNSYPTNRTNLKYLEQITTWYHKTMKYTPEEDEKYAELQEKLEHHICEKTATNVNVLVYIYIAILRAMGMQCRLVLSLQVEPLRPPAHELCSLKNESNKEGRELEKPKTSGFEKGKTPKTAGKKLNKDVKGESKAKEVAKQVETRSKSESEASILGTNTRGKRSKSASDAAKSEIPSKLLKESKEAKVKYSRTNKTDQQSDKPRTITRSKRTKSTNDSSNSEMPPKLSKPNLSKLKLLTSSTDDDFQSEQSVFTSFKSLRSKSCPKAEKDKKSNESRVPDTKTRGTRLKSASEGSTKSVKAKSKQKNEEKLAGVEGSSKMEFCIDKTLATLISLEQPKRPNLTKLKLTTRDDDNDFVDRASWRRSKSKSPMVNELEAKEMELQKEETTPKLEATKRQKRSSKRVQSPPASKSPLLKSKSTDDEGMRGRSKAKSPMVNELEAKEMELQKEETTPKLEATKRQKRSCRRVQSPPAAKSSLLKSKSTDDDGFVDRASWRRSKSKSPMVNELESMEMELQKEETTPKLEATKRRKRSCKRMPSPTPNYLLLDSDFQSDNELKAKPKNPNKFKIRAPSSRSKVVPQVDGYMDESSDTSEDEENIYRISQLDGADDKPSKLKLKSIKTPPSNSDVKINKKSSLSSKTQGTTTTTTSDDGTPRTPFQRKPHKDSPNISKLRSPPPNVNTSPSKSTISTGSSRFFSPKTFDVKEEIIKLVKSNVREEKQRHARQSRKSRKSYREEDSDSDFIPDSRSPRQKKPPPNTKVKKRVLPRSQLEALAKEKSEMEKKKTKGIDIWVEVFLEEEEKWISADVITGKVHCIKEIYNKASHPISYILSWDNANRIKDVTKRYCPNWNTVTRKLRIAPVWWQTSLTNFIGTKTARDKAEDDDLARLQLDQPLPKTITEYKDHPLYVLKRHLLKFQAIYPPDAVVLGFVRKEEVYSRDCVHLLHSRDIWLKHAKVVRPGEQPYKIVKARPKYDKLSQTVITDQLLEIFGKWQVQDYDPPTAENGVVPRNAYGNVELFKSCMLPKKCVHLQLPGLNKIARKLNMDCAPAVVGFDFHGGWNHAVYDGFIVCEENRDALVSAWEAEQDVIVKREQEKYEKRVFGNWRRLIKAALIRKRLNARYNFGGKGIVSVEESEEESPPVEEKEKKKKRPKFMSRK